MSSQIKDPVHALKFLLAGNAHVTFVSVKTGTRFTYKVEQADPRPGDTRPAPHFVSLLTAPDHYEYLGCIFGGNLYSHGRKSRVGPDASSAKAFAWVWRKLTAGQVPEVLEVWHEGRCGKCSRRLTDPSSIESGLGPICRGKAS